MIDVCLQTLSCKAEDAAKVAPIITLLILVNLRAEFLHHFKFRTGETSLPVCAMPLTVLNYSCSKDSQFSPSIII